MRTVHPRIGVVLGGRVAGGGPVTVAGGLGGGGGGGWREGRRGGLVWRSSGGPKAGRPLPRAPPRQPGLRAPPPGPHPPKSPRVKVPQQHRASAVCKRRPPPPAEPPATLPARHGRLCGARARAHSSPCRLGPQLLPRPCRPACLDTCRAPSPSRVCSTWFGLRIHRIRMAYTIHGKTGCPSATQRFEPPHAGRENLATSWRRPALQGPLASQVEAVLPGQGRSKAVQGAVARLWELFKNKVFCLPLRAAMVFGRQYHNLSTALDPGEPLSSKCRGFIQSTSPGSQGGSQVPRAEEAAARHGCRAAQAHHSSITARPAGGDAAVVWVPHGGRGLVAGAASAGERLISQIVSRKERCLTGNTRNRAPQGRSSCQTAGGG
jgi:hypothetical protein